MEIRIIYDSHASERLFGRFRRDQIPYASAVALTAVVKSCQKAIRANLPKKFTIRNTWTARGIRAETARKSDWPDTVAAVGSIDQYMVQQETGGARRAGADVGRVGKSKRSRRTHAVIPVRIREHIGRAENQVIPRSKWPSRIVKPATAAAARRRKGTKPKPFVATIKGRQGVYVRTEGRRLRLLYGIDATAVDIHGRDWLVKTTTAISSKRMQPEFEKALTRAIATAR